MMVILYTFYAMISVKSTLVVIMQNHILKAMVKVTKTLIFPYFSGLYALWKLFMLNFICSDIINKS